jgi:hypothetical protein
MPPLIWAEKFTADDPTAEENQRRREEIGFSYFVRCAGFADP